MNFNFTPNNTMDIVRYLMSEYDVTEAEGARLVETYNYIYSEGVDCGSFVYYIGDEIAKADMIKKKS